MKKWLSASAILAALAAGGCQTTKNPYDPVKPIDQMDHAELCSYYHLFLSNPANTDEVRRIATEKMHAKGC